MARFPADEPLPAGGLTRAQGRVVALGTVALLLGSFLGVLVACLLATAPRGASPWAETTTGLAVVAGLATGAAIVGGWLLLRRPGGAWRLLGALGLALLALALDVLLALWALYPLDT